MDELTKEQYEELKNISKEITILRMKRIEQFGADWQIKLNRYGTGRREKPITDPNVIEKHLRKMDEVIALKGYTIGKLCRAIGVSRGVYGNMRNGHLSGKLNRILSNLDWDKI